MSKKSNNQGRAYEFIYLQSLYEAIRELRSVKILNNSSFTAAKRAWNTLSAIEKRIYTQSAKSTIQTIFALEPNIVEKDDDELNLFIQADKKGQVADVRDIIIERTNILWQIGLSIKHNHMAVKHSRLSRVLDFGEKWYGVKCSSSYWNDIKPVFDFLEREHKKGTYFHDLKSKEDDVYVPILKAFSKEIEKQIKKNKALPRKLVEYILSIYDFYKIISIDSDRITTIQSFNMYGTLNKPSKKTEAPNYCSQNLIA